MDWSWIVLIVVIVLLLGATVYSSFKNKKTAEGQKQALDALKVGDRVTTHIGVYGTVKSIKQTTDGKVLTIETGDKNKSTLEVNIGVISGFDVKEEILLNPDGSRILPEETNNNANSLLINKEESMLNVSADSEISKMQKTEKKKKETK